LQWLIWIRLSHILLQGAHWGAQKGLFVGRAILPPTRITVAAYGFVLATRGIGG